MPTIFQSAPRQDTLQNTVQASPAEMAQEERRAALLQAEGLKGKLVGGAVVGVLSASTGFDYVCTQKASYPGEQALACALSEPGVKLGSRVLRSVPHLITGPLSYVAPSTQYVTQFPAKAADLTAAVVAWSLDGIPWDNVKALVQRLPNADYPAHCDPTEGAQDCPDPLSWQRATWLAPYCEGLVCTAIGVAVGAYVGKLAWRDGVRALAAMPVVDTSTLPLDALTAPFPWLGGMRTSVAPPYNFAVKIARAEVARREGILQAPDADERAPLLQPSDENI